MKPSQAFALERPTPGCVVLTFNHGKANEMGSDQLRALEKLTQALRKDPSVRLLITRSTKLTRRGRPVFVAGANVTERLGWSPDRVRMHVAWQRGVIEGIRTLPFFHVAICGGVALGWGAEYLLAADYVLVHDGASIGLPETGLGIVPGAGGTALLASRVGRAQALRLGLTGETLDPDQAVAIGFAQERFTTAEEAMERAMALGERVALRSPTAMAAYKTSVLRTLGKTSSDVLGVEARGYALCVSSGDAAVGRDNFAAVRAGEAVPWGPRQLLEEGAQ